MGSKRILKKNIRPLNGIPLIAYTIQAAKESDCFTEIIVSTDSEEIAEIAVRWGASVPLLRPKNLAVDMSVDFDWIRHCIDSMVRTPFSKINYLALLRPTSPLRRGSTIADAIEFLTANPWADSLRAMEITDKHPGKMWQLSADFLAIPYLNQENEVIPTHNRSTQSLQQLWIQNASLEIIRFSSLLETGSISGRKVIGYKMPGHEGFDLNTELDWDLLQVLIARNPEILCELPNFGEML